MNARLIVALVLAWALLVNLRESPAAGPQGNCRHCRQHDLARAGCPQCVGHCAKPSYSRHYRGYYVGGGKTILGQAPKAGEGTWGWDYGGFLFPKRIALGWWHSKHQRYGDGSYRRDGPHLKKH